MRYQLLWHFLFLRKAIVKVFEYLNKLKFLLGNDQVNFQLFEFAMYFWKLYVGKKNKCSRLCKPCLTLSGFPRRFSLTSAIPFAELPQHCLASHDLLFAPQHFLLYVPVVEESSQDRRTSAIRFVCNYDQYTTNKLLSSSAPASNVSAHSSTVLTRCLARTP